MDSCVRRCIYEEKNIGEEGGYAKAAVSALTREAVASGAYAGVHVEENNEPAIRVYRNLGYRITKTRTWIFAHP